MNKLIVGAALAAAFGLSATAVLADTLSDVKAKGFVQCGIAASTPGFSIPDANNAWVGLDVEYCRAMAAAIFNNADAVRYTPLSGTERFAALGKGEVDVLTRTTTWTMARDTTLGISFTGVTYYDGQGFMVRKKDNFTSATQLGGATICIEKGTTTELNAADYFAANNLEYKPLMLDSEDETVKAFEDSRCAVFTTDASGLAGERATFADPEEYVILPEIISKEPLGPSVRQGDPIWFNISRWTYFALLNAEELGVTSKNVDEMLGSDNPEIKRLLGVEGDFGTPMGLDKDWAYRIIKLVGNYAEIFDRTVGPNTPLKLPRGLNALWKDGGIQYAPPVR
jgi:general L-amino acid transport system substrate-binding protein